MRKAYDGDSTDLLREGLLQVFRGTLLANSDNPTPVDDVAPGLFGKIRFDLLSGFLVFWIAMPLCLAVAEASGFPAVAGIWTAVIGGILTPFISNSQLTIKGPAAGLIVIVLGAGTELGAEFGEHLTPEARKDLGYRLTLGIGVTAGVVQILFGLVRAGRLVDLFPLTPVHGMLAGIGIILISKQAYAVIGVATPNGGPFTLLSQFPQKLAETKPDVVVVGATSLMLLFGMPCLSRRFKALKKMPSQLIVLVVAVVLGFSFQSQTERSDELPRFVSGSESNDYSVGPNYLIKMDSVLSAPEKAFVLPDFSGLATVAGLRYLVLFAVIGSLESLLSAKAIELQDPWRRKTNFDRDLLAVGLANTASAAIGGLPMISEIARSKANIDSGGRTRAANFVHGVFLLAFVLAFPSLINRIPLAALGAMLVFTGFRLASPKEFVRTYKIGSEQFVVFVGTILATLATNLLTGIVVGIAVEVLIRLWNGAPITGLLKSDIDVVPEGDALVILVVKRAAVFHNWPGLRKAILTQSEGRKDVVIDMSKTRLVDQRVMQKLLELVAEFDGTGKTLRMVGLQELRPVSEQPAADRERSAGSVPTSAT